MHQRRALRQRAPRRRSRACVGDRRHSVRSAMSSACASLAATTAAIGFADKTYDAQARIGCPHRTVVELGQAGGSASRRRGRRRSRPSRCPARTILSMRAGGNETAYKTHPMRRRQIGREAAAVRSTARDLPRRRMERPTHTRPEPLVGLFIGSPVRSARRVTARTRSRRYSASV